MAIPADAIQITDQPDPTDIKDYVIPLANQLEDNEEISTIDDFTLTVLAEGVAYGFTILDDDPVMTEYPSPELINDNTSIRFWATIDPDIWGDPDFEGGGVTLPAELTFWTNSTPPRRIQLTLVITFREH